MRIARTVGCPAGRHPARCSPAAALEAQLARHASLQATLLAQLSTLLAALHFSRGVALQYGWNPWRKLVHQAREQAEAAQQHHARHSLAKALAAWMLANRMAAWGPTATLTCTVAVARQQRQHALLWQCLQALQQHADWSRRKLQQRRISRLASQALQCWRQHAAAEMHRTQQLQLTAVNHAVQCTCRRTLSAWRQGKLRCKQEQASVARQEARRSTAQRYLQEHRQAKALARGDEGSLLPCSSSAAENMFDPNIMLRDETNDGCRCPLAVAVSD